MAFATTGDPNVAGRPAWPVCNATCDVVLDVTKDGVTAGTDPWKARPDVIAAAAERLK